MVDYKVWLTPAQAARALGLSRERVVALNNRGELAAIRTPLGRLFDPDVVEALRVDRETRRNERGRLPRG